MKLATYKDGSRDGQLVVVSRDLATAHFATGIAARMQQALDDWGFIAPQLQDLSETLNHGKARHAFPFDARRCMAPLPRAGQWAVGAAYPSHGELLRQAQGAAAAADPLLVQGASDGFLGPCDPIVVASEGWAVDVEAGLAAVAGDLPAGATPEEALDGVRLLLLAGDVRLHALGDDGAASAYGLVQARPATAFGPVAVTPDELGEGWQGGRVHGVLQVACNGRKLGLCDAGAGMAVHFGQLLAQLARTRPVRAGALVGTGPVADRGDERNGRTEWPRGFGCIAGKRAMETVQDGQPATGWLRWGDTLRIELKGRDGQSVFGAIDHAIAPPAGLHPVPAT